ncbi:MAG: hypothetical protein EOP48_05360 [Sphingobacteriales bacterium]|nr:MAG: hypothetical protein EOP48_05360 [Sphingobacteriales bacterium]
MSKSKLSKLLLLCFIITSIGLIRVGATLSSDFKIIANFSPIGAIALFGAAYFKNHFKAIYIPLLILILSDVFISRSSGYGFFYSGWYFTYIAFILMIIFAKITIRKIAIPDVTIALVSVILIHWTVSDLSPMFIPGLYPRTISGYFSCLRNAIPFEIRFFYGTLFYSLLMFGSYEMMKARVLIKMVH